MKISTIRVVAFVSPFVLFVIFSFLYRGYSYFFPWAQEDQISAPWYVIISRDLFSLAVIYFYVIAGLVNCRELRVNRDIFWFSCLLISMIALSLFNAPYFTASEYLQHLVRNFFLLLLFVPPVVLIINSSSERFLPALGTVFIACGVGVAILGLILYFRVPSGQFGGLAAISTLGNHTNFGVALLLPSFLLVAHLLIGENSRIRKIFLVSGIAVCGVATLLTLSFQSMMALILGIFVIIWLVKQWKATVILPILVALLLVATYGAAVAVEWLESVDVMQRVVERLQFKLDPERSTSYSGRVEQLNEVVKFVSTARLDNVLLGNNRLGEYRRYDNQYFNLLMNSGFICLFLFLCTVGTVLLNALYINKSAIRLLTGNEYIIFVSCFVTILVYAAIISNFTAIIQRFPLNLYFSVSIGVLFTNFHLIRLRTARAALGAHTL